MTKISTTTNRIKKKAPGNAHKLPVAGKIRKLTERQKDFCREFMIDKNMSAAARRAGYNARNAHGMGFNLMQNPLIKAEIERLMGEVIEEAKVTHSMITAELMKIAFSDFNDFVELSGSGSGQTVVFKPTSALAKGNGKMIKTLEIGKRGIKLQLHSKEQALDMLAKHVGYFGVDNSQKTPQGVLVYLPDNGRGDVVPPEEETNKK